MRRIVLVLALLVALLISWARATPVYAADTLPVFRSLSPFGPGWAFLYRWTDAQGRVWDRYRNDATGEIEDQLIWGNSTVELLNDGSVIVRS